MNPSRAAGYQNKSLSARLYRLTQQHKHWFFIVPALIVLLTVVIYPIIFATGVSLFRVTFASQSRPFVGLQNFERMLSNDDFLQSTYNTLFYVVFSVSGSFILGFGAALLLRRVTVGKDLLRLILIIPITMAPIVVGLMWNWMLDPLFGLINWFFVLLGIPRQTLLAQAGTARMTVVLVDIWQWYPLVFLIIEAGMATLPRAPYESARLEGVSSWMIFRRITLPLLRPVILVALLLRTVDAFRTFDIVRVMTDGGPALTTETLSLYLYRTAFTFNKLSRAAAGSILMLLVIGLISALMFRFLYRDVEVG
ncbi:MAG: sugar ABC transporter permease [Anaerolineae bacterium]|nr:sugar ABC transporter permease [Anaerolineae bacterium]